MSSYQQGWETVWVG
jgi:hypothetical protein